LEDGWFFYLAFAAYVVSRLLRAYRRQEQRRPAGPRMEPFPVPPAAEPPEASEAAKRVERDGSAAPSAPVGAETPGITAPPSSWKGEGPPPWSETDGLGGRTLYPGPEPAAAGVERPDVAEPLKGLRSSDPAERRRAILTGLVASEILGPPLALRRAGRRIP